MWRLDVHVSYVSGSHSFTDLQGKLQQEKEARSVALASVAVYDTTAWLLEHSY